MTWHLKTMTVLLPSFQFFMLFISVSFFFFFFFFFFFWHDKFISVSCLVTVAWTSKTMLNRSGKSRRPSLDPDFSDKAFSFCPLSIMLAVGFSHIAFIMLKYAPSAHTFLSVFIINVCCTFSKASFYIYWYDHVIFVFSFVYVIYYLYWFENIVLSLHPLNECHLVMVYDHFNVLVFAVCQCFFLLRF